MAKERVVRVSDLEALIAEKSFEVEVDGGIPPQPPQPEEFKMIWPTPPVPVVTQWYGVNKHLYERFGLPGHEGLDMRAPMGVVIVACADGEVYRVAMQEGQGGNYGIHVRIRSVVNGKEYKHIYAHFERALVNVGDQVKAGQEIGRSDNTGNSYGAHLHLSLKLTGIGTDSFMPYDIINPVPYFSELFPGKGWEVMVGGNFRSSPEVGNNLLRYLGPGTLVKALEAQPDDWWKVEANGAVGWFWNPGYKLGAV